MARRQHSVAPELLARARQMRHESVPAERKLWSCLRNRQLGGYKFRRQFAIGQYVADFCCLECKLIIELDGESHEGRHDYDERRTEHLSNRGFAVVRYRNTDVHENLEGVLLDILQLCEDRSGQTTPSPSPQPSPPSTGARE